MQNSPFHWTGEIMCSIFQVDPGGSPDCGLCGVNAISNQNRPKLAANLDINHLSILARSNGLLPHKTSGVPAWQAFKGCLSKSVFTKYLKIFPTWNLFKFMPIARHNLRRKRKSISCLMMSIKVESHEFKPFKDAAEDYANKYWKFCHTIIIGKNLTHRHLQRRPNNSIGCLEETKLRGKGEIKSTDVLQVRSQE